MHPIDKTSTTIALIGLGANLGDRAEQIRSAWHLLGKAAGVRLLALSSLHQTEPVGGPPNQPDYLNAAGLLETTLGPEELLDALERVESALGRVRNERWGPRTIDLDLLLFGGLRLETERLSLPHPRMTERLFVLIPAAEIAPTMRHPITGQTIIQMRTDLQTSQASPPLSRGKKTG